MQRFYHIALVLTIVAGFSGCSDKAEAPPPAKAVEAPPPPPALTPDVTIDSGKLSGDSDAASGVKIFRGIPFAAAPVGDLRWRAPAPVAPWTEVRAATTFGSPCPQPGTLAVMMGGTLPPTSEDCLSLNVWTPAATAADKLPVMVWIHGGGLSLGWSSQGAYDGIELAKRGVVFVSINYRLGPLGFLALPALSEESGNNASGNYGFLDQVAALQWVQRNIARFGGDPKQVTIFGESAGGTSVFALLASPTTEGLFQRAIAQSPWVTDTNIAALKTPGKIVGSAEAMGTQWAETIVGAGGDTSLANLRSIPAVDMIGDQKPQLPMFITVDGQFMPANGEEIFRTGAQRQVPMIVGTNADEGTLFMMGGYNNRAQYQASVKAAYGAFADEVLALYPAAADADARPAANQWLTDTWFLRAARGMLDGMAKSGSATYQYQFTRGSGTRPMGASHGSEIGYVFNVNSSIGAANVAPDEIDEQLRAAMIGYWTTFAKSGNPNMAGLTAWPQYTADSRAYLQLGDTIVAGSDLGAERLDQLDALVARITKQD